MATRKREPGSLTNSARFKEEKENTIGAKAKKLIENLPNVAQNVGERVSEATTKVVETSSAVGKTTGDIAQTIIPSGSSQSFQSSSITRKNDVYGGLAFPKTDFNELIPSDLLNPEGLPQIDNDTLSKGLQTYAGASRAIALRTAAFKYLEDVGKAGQQQQKAEQSFIKHAKEQVKTQQEIVHFDIANVEFETSLEKLKQADQKLIMGKINTQALINETQQLRLLTEALEQKRDVGIKKIEA